MRYTALMLALLGCTPSAEIREDANVWRDQVNDIADTVNDAHDAIEEVCPVISKSKCERLIDMHDGLRLSIKVARKLVDVWEHAAAIAESSKAALVKANEAKARAMEQVDGVEKIAKELAAAVQGARDG